jgi:hypothetical protein
MRMAQHQAVGAIVDWLRLECPGGDGILNVAGNRESKAPGAQQTVMSCMVDVIRTVNGRQMCRSGGEVCVSHGRSQSAALR